MTETRHDAMAIVERVLQILDEGSTVATYKFAVLLGLLDLCVESTDRHGQPPDAVTTRQLAVKVVELYWRQARPWTGEGPALLRQNASSGLEIVARVEQFRRHVEPAGGVTVPAVRARMLDPKGWQRLVDDVEWKLIEMPLPKLQRVRGQDAWWLYRIAWNDTDRAPTRAQVAAYQRDGSGPFDNQVRLQPGVGLALSRLHAVLRPFIQGQWAAKVASLNKLDEARLPDFLFGSERSSLEPVRAGLVDMQRGACFYCGGSLLRGEVHVDHFLPWARHPDDGLGNLVAADRACNGQKRDHLADHALLARWRNRLDEQQPALDQVASAASWDVGGQRVLGAARALYLPLPDGTRLWAGRDSWVNVDPLRVQAALA